MMFHSLDGLNAFSMWNYFQFMIVKSRKICTIIYLCLSPLLTYKPLQSFSHFYILSSIPGIHLNHTKCLLDEWMGIWTAWRIEAWIWINKWKNKNYPKTTGIFTAQDQYALPVAKDLDSVPEIYSSVSYFKFLKWTVQLLILHPCHQQHCNTIHCTGLCLGVWACTSTERGGVS